MHAPLSLEIIDSGNLIIRKNGQNALHSVHRYFLIFAPIIVKLANSQIDGFSPRETKHRNHNSDSFDSMYLRKRSSPCYLHCLKKQMQTTNSDDLCSIYHLDYGSHIDLLITNQRNLLS